MRLLHRLRCPWSSEAPPSVRYRGEYAELVAASYLRAQGLRILRRNFRWGRSGELDIVARQGETLVVCEVKSTISPASGAPSRAIDHSKRRRLRYGARSWLAILGRPAPVRFDTVEVYLRAGELPLLEWTRDAFPLREERAGR